MITTYYCKLCDKKFTRVTKIDKPPFSIKCPNCDTVSNRVFKNITSEKEDDNVSAAIDIMKYSSLPSGKDKVNF